MNNKMITMSRLYPFKTPDFRAWVVPVAAVMFGSTLVFATTPPQAAWYRYYDRHGTANISGSVTPEHIQRGYDALDRNMQVLQHVPAFSAQRDTQYASNNDVQARQKLSSDRLKLAYGSSQNAMQKRNANLTYIQRQILLQQQQLQQLKAERSTLLQQKQDYVRKGQAVPADLTKNIANNAKNMAAVQYIIVSLQNSYQTTSMKYEQIINQLKTYE